MCQFFLKCLSIVFFVFFLRHCHAFSSSWPSTSSNDILGSSTSLPGAHGLWDPAYLSSKMTVRLVKKSWTPKGSKNDKYVEEFSGDVTEAYNILRSNTNHEYIERPLSQAGELFAVDNEFDRNLDSIILFHPLFSSADDPGWSIPTITALAMRNVHRQFNIFLYNFPQLHKNQLFTIVSEVFGFEPRYEEMAEAISPFILEGVRMKYWQPSNIHFIGFSYSGNLLGYVARYVKYATKTKINTILSLDPFSAQYNENLIHVSYKDAEVVHILHSSSYVQGTRERIGTADFVFNDGFIQPECKEAGYIIRKVLGFQRPHDPFECSHGRIIQRFWYLILYPSKFQARQCETWPMFRQCECEGEKQTFISYPIVNRDVQGTHYIRTTDTKPYGQGDKGAHCSPGAMEKYKQFKEKIENQMQQPNKSKS